MATSTRQIDPSMPPFEAYIDSMGIALAGTSEYPMVHRRMEGIRRLTSEPFEALRDALKLESRLRVDPPDPWVPERQTVRERSWTARGHVVRLRTPGVIGSWTVSVDGEDVLEDASRMQAFETAAERMREVSMRR